MTAPAAFLAGSVTLASTPADTGGSGVASVLYEYQLISGSTWTTACTCATTPFTCAFNTASVADGLYDFRATATDNAGRTTTSTTVTARRIDNTNPVTSTLADRRHEPRRQRQLHRHRGRQRGGSGVAHAGRSRPRPRAPTPGPTCAPTPRPRSARAPATSTASPTASTTSARSSPTTPATRSPRRPRPARASTTTARSTSVTNPVNNARVSGNVTMTANATDPAGVSPWPSSTCLGASTGSRSAPTPTAALHLHGRLDPGRRRHLPDPRDRRPTARAPDDLGDDHARHRQHAPDRDQRPGGQRRHRRPIDAGDTLTFTWSEPMAPASILTGWSGGATADPRPRQRRRRRRHARPLRRDRHDEAQRDLGDAGAAPASRLGQQHRLARRHDDDVRQRHRRSRSAR